MSGAPSLVPGRPEAMHLVDYLDARAVQQVATRDGFGEGLVEAGRRDARVVAVCADLAESTRMQAFRDAFPDRFIASGAVSDPNDVMGSVNAIRRDYDQYGIRATSVFPAGTFPQVAIIGLKFRAVS